MATIEENYVSFETAKLLKEKGFDSSCMGRYSVRSKEFHLDCTKMCNNGGLFECAAPSQSIAMKWLREVYKIYIDISPTYSEVEKTIHFIWQIFDSNYDVVGDCEIFYGKYEEACEAAIKYCLENLI